jgi:hypothetical protein
MKTINLDPLSNDELVLVVKLAGKPGDGPGIADPELIARLVREIHKARKVVELKLCETERLVLRPDTLYRFVVAPDCDRCTELGAVYLLELQQRKKQA